MTALLLPPPSSSTATAAGRNSLDSPGRLRIPSPAATQHLPLRWRDASLARRTPPLAVFNVGATEAELAGGLGLPLPDSDAGRNPAVSTTYRPGYLPRPNPTVLDAQAKVCTGPLQTRPLGEDQAFKVLDTILKSGAGLFVLDRRLIA